MFSECTAESPGLRTHPQPQAGTTLIGPSNLILSSSSPPPASAWCTVCSSASVRAHKVSQSVQPSYHPLPITIQSDSDIHSVRPGPEPRFALCLTHCSLCSLAVLRSTGHHHGGTQLEMHKYAKFCMPSPRLQPPRSPALSSSQVYRTHYLLCCRIIRASCGINCHHFALAALKASRCRLTGQCISFGHFGHCSLPLYDVHAERRWIMCACVFVVSCSLRLNSIVL